MDYELTKKLKHAGFPLSEYPETLIGIRGSEPLKLKGIIQEPTLSELIDACGKNFPKLSNEYGEWECGEMEYCCGEHGYSWETITLGKTPEEAVARLWLKLNE